MDFISLNGKRFSLDVRQCSFPLKTEESCKSKFQFTCGQLIKAKFAFNPILEEFYIPEEKLYLDFFLPVKRLAFEIQGKQHEKYSEFFHGSLKGFQASQERDKKKAEWCRINSIQLISVNSVAELEQVLNG